MRLGENKIFQAWKCHMLWDIKEHGIFKELNLKKINPKFLLSTIFQRQEATEFSKRDTELEIYKYELNPSSSSQFVI